MTRRCARRTLASAPPLTTTSGRTPPTRPTRLEPFSPRIAVGTATPRSSAMPTPPRAPPTQPDPGRLPPPGNPEPNQPCTSPVIPSRTSLPFPLSPRAEGACPPPCHPEPNQPSTSPVIPSPSAPSERRSRACYFPVSSRPSRVRATTPVIPTAASPQRTPVIPTAARNERSGGISAG